jgi:aspartyl-tRNA(Asn)/glutamyl-tRNA(Gln) amidotransferase subunit C
LTPEDLQKLESLAGLRLDQEERAVLAQRLERLLEYVRQIESIDSTGVTPIATTLEGLPSLREDVVEESLPAAAALANAPDPHDSHFRIPGVMRQSDGENA